MDIKVIKEYVSYNSKTGELTYKYSGKRCTSLDKDGYIRVSVKGKKLQGHRVAWMLHHNTELSSDIQIDHINRVKEDNRINNLRLATPSQQGANKHSWGIGRKQGKWRAQTKVMGKHIHIGHYDCPLLARVAYIDKMREIHGEYAPY